MDKKYMDMAYEQADKSTCLRNKVGAVFVLNEAGVNVRKI